MSSTTAEVTAASNTFLDSPEPGKKTRKVLRKKQSKPKPIKKYIWLAGHVLTLTFGGIYLALYFVKFFFSYFWLFQISYRLSFIGVLASYTITILTTFGTTIPGYHTLLATENFQNLSLALIWLISRASAFKLFPYYIVSLLQIASNYHIEPILKVQNSLGDLVALSELSVSFALFFDTLLFRGTSGFALAFYLAFYWLRINFSPYTQLYLLKYAKIIDERVIPKQKPEIQAKWNKIKAFIEFRRNRTKEAIENGSSEELIANTVNEKHPYANLTIGRTENYQIGGTDLSTADKKPSLSELDDQIKSQRQNTN